MRLLHLNGQGIFSLTEYTGDDIPSYAILSHTWGAESEEVTFEDIGSDTKRTKAGYEKLIFSAKQAAIDKLQYFWVDTCCIDKSNSVELQHAINSMFRWYQNADRCYVYLSDVNRKDKEMSDDSWHAEFRTSRWFTRGWTLQELLAPKSVEFFSKQYHPLGDKKLLEKEIHEITGIPIRAFQGTPLSDFTPDERMSWVENRQTKYEEDKVYSLQGIFDVHIPLIYGEGWKNASIRLQREIQQSLNSPSIFSSSGASWLVPFNRNPNFIGRESQLAHLGERLFVKGQHTKYAITGLGGIGKTQLVLELAYQIKVKYKSCSIIWIPATNIESLHQSYLNTAKQLSIPGWEDEKTDVRKLLQDYLSTGRAGQWLLVFDNADDINMWISKSGSEVESSRLIDYLPRSEQGCIIFTSRDRKAAVKLAHNNVIDVPEMNEDTATQLLQKCLIKPDPINNRPDTKALLEELTYLPLAIVQAAAYINENGATLEDYLSLLAEQEEEVIELLSEDFEDEGRYHNIKNPVATTWLISFKQIQFCDPLAANILSFMACIEPKDIPLSLLPVGTSRKKEIEAIGTLEAYSFINKQSVNQIFNLHRLVYLAMRNWLRKEQLLTQWTEKAITRLEEVFPGDDYKNRSVWRMYLPHANCVLKSTLVERYGNSRMDLVWKCGMCLYSDGRYDESKALVKEVMENRKEKLGQEHLKTLASMNNLALILNSQGKYDEAEPIYRKTLELLQKVIGQDHPSTLMSMNNLAMLLSNQRKYNEAEPICRQALELQQKVLGQEHPDTLTSMNNLASLLNMEGKYDEAEPIYRQTLQLSQKILGQEHPSTLTSMNNLASLLDSCGEHSEAEHMYRQTLKLQQKILGQEHPSTLTGMNNLALLLSNQRKYDEAEPIYRQMLRLSQQVLGQEQPNSLTSMNNLASLLDRQGKYDEAEPLYRKTLELQQKVLGQEHPDTLTSMSNLASLLHSCEKYNEAEPISRQTLELQQKVLGQEHPYTLISMNNLASLLDKQGKYDEAEPLYRQTLELHQKILGQKHHNTLGSMNNLALLLKGQGKHDEAEPLYRKTLELQQKVLGQEHPDTLISMNNLASLLDEQGRYDEAGSLYRQTLELQQNVLGQEHPGAP